MKVSNSRAFLEEGFRWFGPGDPVPLSHIRQAGASSLFHSLHEIPYGEVWPLESIHERQSLIEESGLVWRAVESVPVHEDVKTGQGDVASLLKNYTQSLRNLAEAGIETVIYNFMPVLDWVRTDMNWTLPSGARCLRFDPIHFAAFELYALARPSAKESYTEAEQEAAAEWWQSRDEASREVFIQSIIDVFPGVKWGLSLDDIRRMLDRYAGIDSETLRDNLERFLTAVIPVAEDCGIRMAIHPDDPPFSVLGLPRIVSTIDDVAKIFAMVDSPANGLCFCSGSFSARPDNDLLKIIEHAAPRIQAAHLRNTQREEEGGFYESGQLEGTADMAAIVQALLQEQDRRQNEGRDDWKILFRPDHGQVMMGDLEAPVGITPGYPAIGRTRGLSEIRGLMHGLRHAENS